MKKRELRWMRLDNAAKIYPAALRQNWSNVFRLSVTLTEPVDTQVLASALKVTADRFPSMCCRLRRGMFWYYLEQLEKPPAIRPEYSYPLTRMTRKEIGQCAIRVIAYENRIAVEFFHALTDGAGGMVFLKSLTAEYLEQKYGMQIPATCGILDRREPPSEEELEDSFLKYTGTVQASRKETTAYPITGTPEEAGLLHITCFRLPTEAVLEQAHTYGVTATAFLCAAMMQAIAREQQARFPNPRKQKPVKVLLPVNLRNLFPSRTLRNFAMYTIPELDPRLGDYDFRELCRLVHHHMGSHITPKKMQTMIATNVSSELLPVVKVMPLFVKNMVMKAIFDAVGEKKSCLSLSNLGNVKLPEEMRPHVARFDFILGTQASAPYNCGVVSFGDQMNITFTRSTKEPLLETQFARVLEALGLTPELESNI